ncbi:MAG TPA: EVE domain-containing protein [Fimbriimonadaceae bacterium]|nr:EVE domain-containing protein [Fimbriimonadaceae bacterium]
MATWIFQGNPDMFEVDKYLEGRTSIQWLVRQYRRFVKAGDEVYIWRAAGKKRGVRGIVAHGTITAVGEFEDDCPELWTNPSPGPEYRAAMDLDAVRLKPDDGMLDIRLVKLHPVLRGMQIVRQQTGTNFRVKEDEAAALRENF